MKKKSYDIKIYLALIALALIFLLGINVTFAYFSAKSELNGSSEMSNLEFVWATATQTYEEGKEVSITPNTTNGVISRGTTFGFYIENIESDDEVVDENNMYGLLAKPYTANSYIRVWVDAYEVIDSETLTLGDENFGRYFQIQFTDYDPAGITRYESTERSDGNQTNIITYFTFEADDEYKVNNILLLFISGIKLLENAPLQILDKDIKLTLNFEAVQSENGAYLSVFNDWKGYSSSWS